jgi:hypothetical protein
MNPHGFVTVLLAWASLVAAVIVGMRLAHGQLATHWISRRPMISSAPTRRPDDGDTAPRGRM